MRAVLVIVPGSPVGNREQARPRAACRSRHLRIYACQGGARSITSGAGRARPRRPSGAGGPHDEHGQASHRAGGRRARAGRQSLMGTARPRSPSGELHLRLAQVPAADTLLSHDPFALLTGMLLDQQFPMERAFAGPRLLADRLSADRLDPAAIADHDPDAFAALAAGPPAVHRYPASMAQRIQALAQHVVSEYAGDTALLWTTAPTGAELLRRLRALPGFGDQKARIFVALLGKQCGVQPAGWREAAGAYGEVGSRRSVADVVDATTLSEVRAYKAQQKAAATRS